MRRFGDLEDGIADPQAGTGGQVLVAQVELAGLEDLPLLLRRAPGDQLQGPGIGRGAANVVKARLELVD